MKTKIIIIVLVLMVISQVSGQEIPKSYCGDGICGHGETEENCLTDCSCVCAPKEIIPIEVPVEDRITEVEEVEVEFFTRERVLGETCGVDADLDGLLCDPNENFINCESDCTTPNLDSILCVGEECVWGEAWFVKVLFIVLVTGAVFLLATDYFTKKKR